MAKKNKDGLDGGKMVSSNDYARVMLKKRQAETKRLEAERVAATKEESKQD